MAASAFFRALRLDLDLFAAGALAPDGSAALAGGGGFRLAVGRDNVAIAVGGAGLTGLAVSGVGGRASVDRLPFDLSLRVGGAAGRVELAGEAGLLLTALTARGEGFAVNASDTTLNVGLRAAFLARVRVHPRVAPFLGLAAEISPAAHPVLLADGRQVGLTPRLWLSLTLGLSFRLR